MLEERVIPAIVEHPQPKKERRDKEAVNDGGGGDIHVGVLAEERAGNIAGAVGLREYSLREKL